MSPKNLALILLKCFGIWLIVAGLGHLSAALETLQWSADASGGFNPRHLFLVQATEALVYMALGILFLVNTESLTQVFFRSLEEPALPPPSPFTYQAIGFSLLGAWVLSRAIPAIVSRGIVLIALGDSRNQPQLASWWSSNWGQLLYGAVEAVVGLLLFLGSRRLASLWFRVQPISHVRSKGERPAS